MSARNFYHTLYQTDHLFRIADESWAVVEPEPPADADALSTEAPAPEPNVGFLAELDALSAAPSEVAVDAAVLADADDPDSVANVPLIVTPDPEPVRLPAEPMRVITTPEPLPQPVPRPTTPSILPPVQQQPRLPQLNHKVLLLADEELDPSNLLFLEKILKAVNLNVNGVDLLNLRGARDVDFGELLKGKYINHFITFGVPFERLNLDIMMDRYAPVRFEGITFLMADSLPTIEADQNLKKRLWAALQRVFLQR